MRKKKVKNISIYLILLFSLILRLVNLNQSFWLDEAAQVIESTRPFNQQFDITSDFHPPLYHLFLHFWLYFGKSEIWVRLPSVFFGLGSVYFLYLLGKILFDHKTSLIASVFLSISSFHIWYSQETRPYMLFVFFSSVATYLVLKNKWIYYFIFAVLLFYTHYFTLFLLIGHFVYIFFFKRKFIKYFLYCCAGTILIFAPWLSEFSAQLNQGLNGALTGWKNVVSVSTFKLIPLTFAKFIFGRSSIENLYIYALAVLPCFLLFVFGTGKSIDNKNGRVLLTLFFVPFSICFVVSLFFPVVAPQRLIFLLPFFYLIVSRAVYLIPKTYSLRYLAILLVLIINIGTLIDYWLNPRTQRENWRAAVSFVEENADQRSLVVFVFPEPFAPYLWYKKDRTEAVGIASKFILNDEDLLDFSNLIKEKDKIFLFQYLTGLTDPADKTGDFLKQNHFILIITKDFPGVGFVHIYKRL